MSLNAGEKLGPYDIVAPIGAGGMGEVYKAHDTRLDRDVAVKVLPEAFSQDEERLARFEREARLLASLNHPNIATIHGLEESKSLHFLVLELVPGETLAERIGRGAIPVDEALSIFKQVAEALEAAHGEDIVHRDLKPANMKITPDGKVKVLDFGLAKAFKEETVSRDLSQSPTVTKGGTKAGAILGTAPYMSPEQARGKGVDERTDIWAFGCCLYEALTGKRAFAGETVSETISSILTKEPGWNDLQDTIPAGVQAILRRCLRKDPSRRLRDVWDIRVEIEEALAEPSITTPEPAEVLGTKRVNGRVLAFGAVFLLALTASIVAWRFVAAALDVPPPTTRFVIDLPADEPLEPGLQPAVALSNDGARLAYVVRSGAQTRLTIRDLSRFESVPLPNTEGASGPFFSPDGQWVGFFAAGTLKRVSLSGGAPFRLCDAGLARGASWGPHDSILFTAAPGTGLWQISREGGTPQVITDLDLENDELTHRWPQILPGGDAVLITIRTARHSSFDDARLAVVPLETRQPHTLIEGGTQGRYVPTGHLVFVRAGALQAVPFDLERLRVGEPAVTLVKDVMTDPTTGAAHFSIAENGSLAYIRGGEWIPARSLRWITRDGVAESLAEIRRPFQSPRLSPEGRRLAVSIERANDDVHIYEMGKATLTRLTFEAGANVAPIWTSDGNRVTFSSNRDGPFNIYWKPADGSGPAERLTTSENIHFPSSWSPDGRVLAYTENHPTTGSDLWTLSLDGDREPQLFLSTTFNERCGMFSPDGSWIAYTSNESGQDEVYVRQFGGGGGQWQISTDGGTEPMWARNGRELFYRNGSSMMAVAVTTGDEFTAGQPRLLFDGAYETNPLSGFPNYDISPDGKRFVMMESELLAAPTQIHVVLNWSEELKRLVPPQ